MRPAQEKWKADVLAGRIVLEDIATDSYNIYEHQRAEDARMTPEQLAQVGPLLARLVPVESVDAAQLGKVAAALPAVAKLASAPKPLLDGLASITSDDWKKIPGFTKDDADKVTAAFGGLDKVAQLPADTLDALAKADPSSLATAAERIPGQVGELEKDWAAFQSDLRTLQDAAKASERATSQVSEDERIAYATLTVAKPTLSSSEADAIYDILKAANTHTLEVGAQGSALEGAGAPAPDSEAIGLLAAIIILLIAFGSLVAAGLPIIVAITGLVAEIRGETPPTERFDWAVQMVTGTVLDPETARTALLAGAEYIVSPCVNVDVIRLCKRYGKLVMSGAFTPTEVLTAWEAGGDIIKIFPAEIGGPAYLKALHGPLPQIRLMPTGGVTSATTGVI